MIPKATDQNINCPKFSSSSFIVKPIVSGGADRNRTDKHRVLSSGALPISLLRLGPPG